MTRAARRGLVLATLSLLAGCADDEQDAGVPVDHVREVAIQTEFPASMPQAYDTVDLPGIREVSGVIRSGERLLVAAQRPGSVRVYRTGSGPAREEAVYPMERPGNPVLSGDTVSVLEQARAEIHRLRWPGLEPLGVDSLPFSVVALSRGCGGLLAVYETGGERLRTYGLRPTREAAARVAAYPGPADFPGATGPGMRAQENVEGVELMDIHNRLVTLPCGGPPARTLEAPYPAGWATHLRLRGFARAGGVVVSMFHQVPADPVTHASVCHTIPRECTLRRFGGLVSIADASDQAVWVATSDGRSSRLYRVAPAELLRWLDSAWTIVGDTRTASSRD